VLSGMVSTRSGEKWRAAERSNGVRLYLGRKTVMLKPGTYTYKIRYHTDRQLGYFDDHDELYWNVTGNGWAFPIQNASATVALPAGIVAAEITTTAYTGKFGASGSDFISHIESGRAQFKTTQWLNSREGLTIAVSWPKGFVFEPSTIDRLRYLLTDNWGLVAGLAALLVSGLFLFVMWLRIGKDPEPGIVFAQYGLPEEHSPASANYVSKMGYSSQTFSAALINLAVKGHLKIVESDAAFVLKKLRSDQNIAPGETVLLSRLFKDREMLTLSNENAEIVNRAKNAHENELARRYKDTYFKTNSMWVWLSVGLCVVAGVIVLLGDAMSVVAFAVFSATLLMHFLFGYLMKAPTTRGRQMLDQLDGFELYLNVAEQKDLELAHPPKKTPELFERFLPYAIALGVENEWGKQFVDVFRSLGAGDVDSYQPRWYFGSGSVGNVARFSQDLGKGLTSAVSAAATPPGSSSGGGGFSGGGGGGGGGGGW